MSRARRGPALVTLLALASAVLTGVTACAAPGTGGQARPDNPAGVEISAVNQDTDFHGAEPEEPYRMPNVTLTADNGQPFNLVSDTAYPVTLVFFGYTNCPDVCPLVMSDLTATYLQLPSAVRAKTQVLFITTDPARDTDSVLRSYLSRYNPSFVGLRGSIAEIKSVAEDMGVAVTGIKRLPGGGYDVGHSSQVIGFRGNIAPVIWTAGTPVPDVVADVETLAGQ